MKGYGSKGSRELFGISFDFTDGLPLNLVFASLEGYCYGLVNAKFFAFYLYFRFELCDLLLKVFFFIYNFVLVLILIVDRLQLSLHTIDQTFVFILDLT